MTELTQQTNSQPKSDFSPEMFRAFEALFEFYAASGVDTIVEESPQDRLAETIRMKTFAPKVAEQKPTFVKSKSQSEKPTQAKSKKDRENLITHEEQVKQAVEIANAAESIENLIAEFNKIQIGNQNAMKHSPLFLLGTGKLSSRLMVIGDCPNFDDVMAGKLFAGEGGKLFDAMLGSIGLSRDDIYLSNFIPRQVLSADIPPGRFEVCEPFIRRLIEFVNPDFLITFGSGVAKHLLGDESDILKLNGEFRNFRLGERKIPSLVLIHPKNLIYAPAGKRNAWRGLLTLQEKLEKNKT